MTRIMYEINEAIEDESRTPSGKILAKCKEYERKNRRYLVEVRLSPTTTVLVDKRKYKKKQIDVDDLRKKYGL